jgi:hypothetical protein
MTTTVAASRRFRAAVHRFAAAVLDDLARGYEAGRRTAPELAFTGAVLAGWALLTTFAAAFAGPRVWLLSGGLLLLSGCGWKFLYRIARDGLYVLSRREGSGPW